MSEPEPIEYPRTDGHALYQCPTCQKTYPSYIYACPAAEGRKRAYYAATVCCVQHHCQVCGVETKHFQTLCRTCLTKRQLRKHEVVEWDGECQVFDGDDGWYPSPEEAVDMTDGAVFYVYPSEFRKIHLHPDSVVDMLCDDHHEDLPDYLSGDFHVQKMFAAIEEFNASTDLGSWFPIPGKVIVIDEERFQAYLSEQPPAADDSNPED
jgi:hypothetical protein